MRRNICLVAVMAIVLTACVVRSKSIVSNEKEQAVTQVGQIDFVEKWAEIEKLREQKLPQSMQPKIDTVYQAAKAAKNYQQLLKAIVFQLNNIGLLEEYEEGANRIFTMLKKDAEVIPQPAKSIVYSMIAQMYEDFYSKNYWTLINRTTAMVDTSDIHTWDACSLAKESVKYYLLSLADQTTLQNEPIDHYNEILLKGYDPAYQPTLYDLLTKRALEYFESNINEQARSQQEFVVNDSAYFKDVRQFVKLHIETTDTLSFDYLTLKTYQDLLRFHLKRSGYDTSESNANDGMTALIDADLRRLTFLELNGRFVDTKKMYEEALISMSREYKAYDGNARVLLELAYFYFKNKERSQTNLAEDENRDGYVKAYRLCEQVEKEYPGQQQEDVKVLKEMIERKNLDLRMEAVQLPDKPFLALLKYRNIKTLYLKTFRLNEQQALDYMKKRERNVNQTNEDLAAILESLKLPIAYQQIQLPESNDFCEYTTEIKCEPLKKGCYLILVSDKDDPFSQSVVWETTLVQVSSLMAYDREIDNVTSVTVINRETGAPLAGAKITMYDRNTEQTSFTTNKDGLGNSPKMKRMNDKHYVVEYQNDRLLMCMAAYNRSLYKHNPGNRAKIMTDRAVYRPGQTVYFKAILFRDSSRIEPDLLKTTSVTVRFRDANNQVLEEKKLRSNDFGSVDGHFVIPQGLLNGRMTIQCEDYGSTTIRVEEYKRPTFEVKFDAIKGNYALNDHVRVTAQAKALSGYAIDNAKVQYRIVRRVMYRTYYWWYPPLSNKNREIDSGVIRTDAKGAFTIDFDALADDVKDDRKIYTYHVEANVTDVNGETRSASIDIRIGKKPLLINTTMPDEVLFEKRNDYSIETVNLNNHFTPAKVKVEISALKQPERVLRDRLWKNEKVDVPLITENDFRKDFPFDTYGDEMNPSRFEVLRTIAQYTLDTEKNKQLDLSALKQSGYYKVKLTADNGKGLVVENERYIRFMGEKPGAISHMDQWITPIRTTGEPGEKVEFWIAGGADNAHVYCELIHNNEVVEAKWIKTDITPVKVTYPIKETHRGGFALQFTMIQQNRKYNKVIPVTVPYTNKMLDVKLTTFRDQLLPGENETWTMRVSDKAGVGVLAEVAASLYDASLDHFVPHRWPDVASFYLTNTYMYSNSWSFGTIENYADTRSNTKTSNVRRLKFVLRTDVNWLDATYRKVFDSNARGNGQFWIRGSSLITGTRRAVEYNAGLNDEVVVTAFGRQAKKSVAGAITTVDVAELRDPVHSLDNLKAGRIGSEGASADLTAIETRTNFNETAFFYPVLRTNAEGEVLIEFTIPEALTRWKLLSFAHTRDLKIGTYTNELITQKQVAISANPPRFFRENDVIELTAKVNNLTDADLSGQALLRLYDAVTMEPIDAIIQSEKTVPFEVKTDGSVGIRWKLVIPEGIQAISYKLTAQAGTHTDGEEKTVPVLTNSILVTETLPFSIRAGKEKQLTFDRLVRNQSKTLRHHSLTLEYTSAPAWYAVQSLPYIMEYPYECAEQTFARFYANTLATTIVNKTPRIKQIFDLWNQAGSEALMSNLEKNQELKQVMLEETPWVMQAKNEAERKKRVGLLFDLNRMSNEMNRSFGKLKNAQSSDGGFPWFEGNPSSRYITQHIVAGMAHLKKLDAMQICYTKDSETMIQSGLSYLDEQIGSDYNNLLKKEVDMEKKQIRSIQLHYLYACSFSGHLPLLKHKVAFDYYLQQAGQYWQQFSTYEKAMTALVLHRYGQSDKAKAVIRSLKEHAQQSEEMGMYWKDNVAGYFWYQAPIETQAMLIEAFDEVASDTEAVEEMKIWLLRNKQTNDWKTTKATSEAIYALLMTGGNLLDESQLLEVEVDGRPLAEVAKEPIKPEPGTGYVKTSWQGSDVTPQMGQLKVKNPNRKGIAWGGMYWQYFEQLDQITSAETNLRMNKQLFLRTLTDKGEVLVPIGGKGNSATSQGSAITSTAQLKVGDLVRVRMELRADRDYEYVHLKDMRAAGFEPVSTVSGHRYQNGLWYYESVKDASTNFFITYLRKGTYVFEYDLRVSHVGNFSNGITTFQCMYAPEFSAHSEGIRVSVVGGE